MSDLELALELVRYEDGIATYEVPPLPPTLAGGAQPTLALYLPRAEWTRLGRPTVLNVTASWDAPGRGA